MVCGLVVLACNKSAVRTGSLPYEIKWGTSGGFTGGGEGYILYSDGSVARWKKSRAGATIETRILGKISDEAAGDIRRLIDANKLLQFNHNRAGNMTTALTIISKGTEHTITWPDEPGKTPIEVVKLMEQLQASAKALEHK